MMQRFVTCPQRLSVIRRFNTRWISNVTVTRSENSPDLIVTPLAAKKIAESAAKMNNPNVMLRLAVEGGGCSGFKYVFEFETNPISPSEDILFTQDDSSVVVDQESLELIRGSTLDYEEELIRSSFVVTNNPNAVSGCGCGSSFDLKD